MRSELCEYAPSPLGPIRLDPADKLIRGSPIMDHSHNRDNIPIKIIKKPTSSSSYLPQNITIVDILGGSGDPSDGPNIYSLLNECIIVEY